ncbi:MAG TPA: cytochrome c [Sandaracinaceae bacterium LLY-WYZ-13_1]|nr:cytochrome c [Sandaracinaceae bacterium LLY-WYZ-13_1]
MTRARALLAALAVTLGACQLEGTVERPTPGLHRMVDQPRADAYEATEAFDDGLVMRHPPEGTVSYGARTARAAPAFDRATLRDGRARYETFCAPCHGVTGDGDTVLAADMSLRPPPSLLTRRVRARSDRDLFRIASEGYGLMPGYDRALEPADRWAVVGYLRALQLSRRAPVASLTPAMRRALEEATR